MRTFWWDLGEADDAVSCLCAWCGCVPRRYCAAAFDFLSQSPKIRQELVRVGASSVRTPTPYPRQSVQARAGMRPDVRMYVGGSVGGCR